MHNGVRWYLISVFRVKRHMFQQHLLYMPAWNASRPKQQLCLRAYPSYKKIKKFKAIVKFIFDI